MLAEGWLLGLADPPLLPDLATMVAYLTAVVAVAMTPGPGMVYVFARTLSGGTRSGLVSALGLATGSMLVCLLAAGIVVAMVELTPHTYDVLRYAGALYMAYLARSIVRATPPTHDEESIASPRSTIVTYAQGILTSLLSPTTLLFYFAFIPQFTTHPPSQAPLQFVLLGSICAMLGNSINLAASLGLSRLSRRHIPGARRTRRWIAATLLVGVGLVSLLTA